MTGQRGLYEWFAASVASHPDATALEVAGQQLSYRELVGVSDRVAVELCAVAGRPPERLGLLAGRSVTAYAGYLAGLRLGATVVPLNPGFPAARTAAVAAAARVDVVLTEPGQDEHCPPGPVLRIDPGQLDRRELQRVPEPPAAPGPLDHCYLLFTSGSTGRPKGVPIQHRNISAYLRQVIDRYQIGPGDRLSQTFDLTFDLSVFDLFAAWGAGATVVVPDRRDLLAPARFVSQAGITHWFSVPSVVSLAARLRGLPPQSMPDLRWSLFCGEPLTATQAAAWQAAAPASVLENLYGPTELTLSCSRFRYTGWQGRAGDSVPIGHLHAGLDELVLDDAGRPADEGELCVRGVQRFPGYLDPADNAGRFVRYEPGGGVASAAVVPTATVPDELWYRTGDRVRRTEVGLLHLGRLDHQVKVQGYRVELGEIETALRGQPGVHDAVVLALPGPRGAIELVATCTRAPSAGPLEPAAVLAALRTGLPEYMVPHRLTVLDSLPLNVNGKIDRGALAARNGVGTS